MAQIINITSEALQATIRRLLPSQQGFGEDLQASNVIQPIIDLTPTAEGSALDTDLARAYAFGSQTTFDLGGTSATLANTSGFYRVTAAATVIASGSLDVGAFFILTDGFSSKVLWGLKADTSSGGQSFSENVEFTVFLSQGEELSANTNNAASNLVGSVRQVADTNGTIIVPSGFTPQ
jgi:hypothetical protein